MKRGLLGGSLLFALSVAPAVEAQLPPVRVPAGNAITPAKVNLGKALFWDEQLSSTRTVACGTCHMPEAGGADLRNAPHPGPDGVFGNADDGRGSPGVPLTLPNGTHIKSKPFGLDVQVTGRIAPSVINAAHNNLQFWDGRSDGSFDDPITGANILPTLGSLENQAANPPLGDSEMAHQGRDWNDVANRVRTSKPLALATNIPPALELWIGNQSYPYLFNAAFGSPDVTPARIIQAIATYERTLISDQTPWDRFLRGQAGALSPLEQAGFDVFEGPGHCNLCHEGPLMRNQGFSNIGWRPVAEDTGRFAVTGDPADLGKFKIPGLRNSGLRTAFFHNGGATTLREVVDFYDRGGDFTENLDPLMEPLGLTEQQKVALVAFLETGLTDPRVAAALPPFDRPTLYSETLRAPQNYGTGAPGTGGIAPRLIGLEPPMLGNLSFALTLADGLGGAQAVLMFEDQPGAGVPFLGVPVHIAGVRPMPLLLGALQDNGAGEGYWSGRFALNSDPSLAGLSVFAQGFVLDPGAPLGFTGTDGLQITFFAPRTAVPTFLRF